MVWPTPLGVGQTINESATTYSSCDSDHHGDFYISAAAIMTNLRSGIKAERNIQVAGLWGKVYTLADVIIPAGLSAMPPSRKSDQDLFRGVLGPRQKWAAR